MLNRVVLVGRLTRDPEMRFTQSQRAVCSFNIAVNRNFTSASGEREADFVNIVSWGKTAENVSKYMSKGSLVAIDGRIQTRNYDNDRGERVYVTEVVADSVTFLESKNSQNSRTPSDFSSSSHSAKQHNNQATNNNSQSFDSNKDPFADFGNTVDISDDDLPF